MNLKILKEILLRNGCKNIYVKRLSPNDNSKNQVYLGGSFDILNIFPTSEIICDPKGNWEKDRFKASIKFCWITEAGSLVPAPQSQLILYPKYPEVRLSGFLKGCPNAPSELMASRLPDRLLFMAVSSRGEILGYVTSGHSVLAAEFNQLHNLRMHGVFHIIEFVAEQDNRARLLSEILRIHKTGWIKSKRLSASHEILPCIAPNCGGYTLEAELDITPNGFSEPDFLGYEIKQFHAANFNRFGSEVVTLMTPEPTEGFYVESGIEAFIRKYGYKDKLGRPDRINFGGIHKVGKEHPETHLRLVLIGFDASNNKITRVDGRISLIDVKDNEAASWSFASLMTHWNRKHNLACYVPSQYTTIPTLQYRYGNNLIMGSGTNFLFFLNQMNAGNIYYDPGIKLENASTKPTTKRRSQFRMKSGNIRNLYDTSEIIDILHLGHKSF
ncbi:MAG TPA: MvaI/BcnI family restriction endonuclease [Bacteroidales bacterium]|jgi:hypothetical protein|nr:MvaI/BcnI family restriction endonuclease [Bacteroidales bacterium]